MGEELKVSGKHVKLRIVLFILALAAAVAAFTLGITSIGKKEPGYYEITGEAHDDAPLYQSDFSFTYKFEGTSAEIREETNQIKSVYEAAMLRAYKLTDPKTEYDGFVNLATLNHHPNESFPVSEEFFAVLQTAMALSGDGYSLYAGPYDAEWNNILYISNSKDFDPLANADEAERLSRLLALADPSSGEVELVLGDGAEKTAMLKASAAYLEAIADLELTDAPMLDLSVFRDAVRADIVRKALEEAGYHNGYLSTASGLSVNLSGHSGAYMFYTRNAAGIVQAASVPAAPGSSSVTVRTFEIMKNETGYYEMEKDGVTYRRHPFLLADEEAFGDCLSLMAVTEGDSLTELYQTVFQMMRTQTVPADTTDVVSVLYSLAGDAETEKVYVHDVLTGGDILVLDRFERVDVP